MGYGKRMQLRRASSPPASQQRVAIARALAATTASSFADEPSGNPTASAKRHNRLIDMLWTELHHSPDHAHATSRGLRTHPVFVRDGRLLVHLEVGRGMTMFCQLSQLAIPLDAGKQDASFWDHARFITE
jgi:predicted ABC-type transport system involved in lysophospholipase L1 biosynthesis ATPase subunit